MNSDIMYMQQNSAVLFVFQSELFWRLIAVFLETAYEVAAIRKACLLTYERHIMVGEKQIFFCLEYPHALDVLLAAHAVLLTEFRCKARIAHVAYLGYVRHADIVFKAAVYVFGDILYAVYVS